MTITVTWPKPAKTVRWTDGKLEPEGDAVGHLLDRLGAHGEEVLACPEGPWTAVADWRTDPYALIGGCRLLFSSMPTVSSDETLPDLGPGDLDGEFPAAEVGAR